MGRNLPLLVSKIVLNISYARLCRLVHVLFLAALDLSWRCVHGRVSNNLEEANVSRITLCKEMSLVGSPLDRSGRLGGGPG